MIWFMKNVSSINYWTNLSSISIVNVIQNTVRSFFFCKYCHETPIKFQYPKTTSYFSSFLLYCQIYSHLRFCPLRTQFFHLKISSERNFNYSKQPNSPMFELFVKTNFLLYIFTNCSIFLTNIRLLLIEKRLRNKF